MPNYGKQWTSLALLSDARCRFVFTSVLMKRGQLFDDSSYLSQFGKVWFKPVGFQQTASLSYQRRSTELIQIELQ